MAKKGIRIYQDLFIRSAFTANLDPPRIWNPGPNPSADMDPRVQIH